MRKENMLKNMLTTIVPYGFLAILGFIRVKMYLNTLGEEIYSLNQVFVQLFSYISIVEAGAGALVTQLYYKVILENNIDEINKIYTTSKIMLRKIAAIILGIGFVVSFFMTIFTNNSLSFKYMQIAFMLYLLRSILEYVMLSPRFVLQADQKMYKINNLLNGYKILEVVTEIVILKIGFGYIPVLFVTIIIRAISYLITNRKIFNEYEWLKTVPIDKSLKIRGMKNVFVHRIAGAVYNNTPILLISSFLTTSIVTIYSSYNFITKFIIDITYMISSSIAPSVGNIMVKEDEKTKNSLFEEINIIFFSLAMIIAASLFTVINPFVTIWIGESRVIGRVTLVIIIMTLFHFIARLPMSIMNEVNNLFKLTQKAAMAEACINLLLSFLLVNKYGMTGVVFSTLMATFLTNFWVYPIIVYKKVLKKSTIHYFLRYLFSASITALICYLSYLFVKISSTGYLTWLLNSLIYSLVVTIVFTLINLGTSRSMRSVLIKGVNMIKIKR